MKYNFTQNNIRAAIKQGVTTWSEFILYLKGVHHA